MPYKVITGISDIIANYDLVLCDLWGVIHDGSKLYPNAKNTLEKIRQSGKRLIFISNAPRRAAVVDKVLHNLGVDASLYEAVVTSGEVGFHTICKNTGKYFQKKTGKYYYLGPEKDAEILTGSGFDKTSEIHEADFVMCTGFISDDDELRIYEPILDEMFMAGVPMLCVNPDLLVVKQDGRRINCSGQIAEMYRQMGGVMQYFGKPYPEIYHELLNQFAPTLPKEKILVVGDGIETDIKGAKGVGIDSVLVTGGVIKVLLGLDENEAPTEKPLAELIEESGGATPEYVITSFNWQPVI